LLLVCVLDTDGIHVLFWSSSGEKKKRVASSGSR
jgi:hypothetical protein